MAGGVSTASSDRSVTPNSVAGGTSPPGALASGPSEKPTTEDLKKKLEELGRREKRLRTQQRELDSVKREMKKQILTGATIEPGAELRLLPGRDSSSKDPDDYELIFSHVS